MDAARGTAAEGSSVGRGNWHRLMPFEELPDDGTGCSAEAGGRALAVFRVGEEAFAVDDACPHQGAPLSCGVLSRGEVTCSWHGWHFDLGSGRCTDGLDARVAAHETRLTPDGRVEVRLAPLAGSGRVT